MPSSPIRFKNQLHRDATNYITMEEHGVSVQWTRYGGGVMLCRIVPHSDRGMPLFSEEHDLEEADPEFLVALAKHSGFRPLEVL